MRFVFSKGQQRKLTLLFKARTVVIAFLTGCGLILGALELWDRLNPAVEIFDSEVVYFNYFSEENQMFVDFLDRNNGRIVEINTFFDFSAFGSHTRDMLYSCNRAYPKQNMTEEEFFNNGGSYALMDGYIFNKDLEIPHEFERYVGIKRTTQIGCTSTLQIHIVSDQDKAYSTHGGTGVVLHRVKGLFDIHIEISGASKTIYLIQKKAA